MSKSDGYVSNGLYSGQVTKKYAEPTVMGIYTKWIFICSVAVNAVLLTSIVTIFFMQHYSLYDNDSANKKGQTPAGSSREGELPGENGKMTCISCNYFGPEITVNDTMYDVITETDCGEKLCCIKETGLEDMNSLIIKIITKRTDRSPEDGSASALGRQDKDRLTWWRERRHAAHLFPNSSSDGGVTWTLTDNTGLAFANDIRFVDNRLEVIAKGYYFVYAAYSFDFEDVGFMPLIYHNITSQHPLLLLTGPKEHLMGKFGGVENTEKTHTSYLCGVVYLQRGFQLATHASTYSNLDRSSYANYFGIFQL